MNEIMPAVREKLGIFQNFKKIKNIVYIPASEIAPNPLQPRINFEPQSLKALSESIKSHGILQPITVKKRNFQCMSLNGQSVGDRKYEIISGERRFRAATRAGLKTLPCIIIDCDAQKSAVLALTENMQRENLHFFEEAQAFYDILLITGQTQSQLAQKLSISQSALANKLRLLSLTDNDREKIIQHELSERHARAFVRLTDDEVRGKYIDRAVKYKLSAAACDSEISKLLSTQKPEKSDSADREKEEGGKAEIPDGKTGQKRISLVKDINFFLNSLNHAIDLISESGVQVKKETADRGDYIEIVLSVKKEAKR